MGRIGTVKGGWWMCITAMAVLLAVAHRPAQALGADVVVDGCPRTENFPRPNANGPLDYRKERGGAGVRMVESNHFTPNIEMLMRGNTGTLAQELSFILHVFPNHHRVLVSLARYGLREKSTQPGKLDYTVECYFLKALTFQPDDQIARMLYADYLARIQRNEDAKAQLDKVRPTAAENPLTLNNLGLLYFDIGQYDDALTMAHQAMALGLSRVELRDRLRSKGKWVDPPSDAAPAASASASRATGGN